MLLFFEQPRALTTKLFAFIALINGCEMLLRREHEAAGQNQTTDQQKSETREGAHVAITMNLGIKMGRRNSSHGNSGSSRFSI